MDNKLKANLGTIKTQIKISTKTNTAKKDDKTYEDDDDFDDDNTYDDTMQDENIVDNKIEYRRRLLEIPTEMLPCASKLSYEASYSPPTQDEVKYYKTSGCTKCLVSSVLLAFTIVRCL